MVSISIKALQALHGMFTAEFEQGIKAVLEGLRLAEETGVHVWDDQLLCNGLACALSMGDFATTDAMLNKLLSHLKGGKRFDIGYCHGMSGWRALLQEDFSSAIDYLKLSIEFIHATGFMAAEAIAIHGMVEAQRAKGNSAEAHDYLAKSYEIAYAMKSKYLEFVCFLDEALLAMDRQDDAMSLSLLHKALPLGREQGYVNMHCWQPASMIRICEKALENGIEVDYVRKLISKHHLIPEIPPQHIENWPWPLKIRTLGAFEMRKDDEPMAFTGKVQKKPLDLLKALIAFGGKEVSEPRLTDELWPDAEGDLAHRSFETNLYRLRKLLGDDRVLQLQGGQLSLDPRFCWTDTQALESICEDIEALLKKENGGKGESQLDFLLEKASRLYRGDFLPADGDQPWTTWMRENMRRRYLKILGKAGSYWEAVQQWGKAVESYQRALKVDGLLEEFYQRLMVCYQARGQTVEVAKTYQRCRSVFSAHLAVGPSEETEAIYRRLLRKN